MMCLYVWCSVREIVFWNEKLKKWCYYLIILKVWEGIFGVCGSRVYFLIYWGWEDDWMLFVEIDF